MKCGTGAIQPNVALAECRTGEESLLKLGVQLGQVGVDTKNLIIETSAAERNEEDRENLQLDANARR